MEKDEQTWVRGSSRTRGRRRPQIFLPRVILVLLFLLLDDVESDWSWKFTKLKIKSIFVCGQRPRNYLSFCSCSCWIFCLIYALPTATTRLTLFFNFCQRPKAKDLLELLLFLLLLKIKFSCSRQRPSPTGRGGHLGIF